MTTPSSAASPAFARRLLTLALGSSQARQIEPSLDELFGRRVARDGAMKARLWYWRQVLGFAMRRRSLGAAHAQEVAQRLHGNRRGQRGPTGPLSPEAWLRDLRLAVRSLRRQPGFAALAIGTLALGIGANTAIFSVLYGSLLRPLPYPEPERLVWMSDGHENFGGAGANQSVPNLLDLQTGTELLESMTIYKMRSGNLATTAEPVRVRIMYASSDLFRTLGLPLQLGRDFTPADDIREAAATAILTDDTWRTRFGADPAIVGTTVDLDGRAVVIAGVADGRFRFRGDPQVVMALQHVGGTDRRGNRGHFAFARMAPGADLDSVRAELDGIYAGLVEEYPEANAGWHTWAEPFRDFAVGRNARSLQLMAGAAALVLLIACVNVANLMLVRSETRQREFAVRYSLGATRAGLLPLFVSEGLVLALAGAAVGIVGATWGVDLLVGLYGDSLARADEVTVNSTSLLFAVSIALLVGVLIGLVPLLRSRADAVHETLKDGSRGASATSSRLGRTLVGIEVALAVLIVAGAGLLTNSLWRLQGVDLGLVEEEQVLTFRVSLPTVNYHEADQIEEFHARLLAEVRRVPGVVAVGLVNRLPLLGGDNMNLSPYDNPDVEVNFASYRMVTDGYFEATGLRLLAGRWLDRSDFDRATASVVINDRLARALFPDGDPIGRRIADPMLPPEMDGHFVEGLEVVGVMADVVGGRPDDVAPPAFYFSFARAVDMTRRHPQTVSSDAIGTSALVRTAGAPLALAPDMRRAVARVDPEVPLFEIRTLEQLAHDRLGTRRFAMSLFGVFAGLALLLGAVGIYGVMSFGVAQRSRELGVRMALGASPRSVLRMVLGEGIRLTLPGIVVGVIAALGASRLLASLLYEISAVDPATYLAVAGILGIVCLAAAYVPALRATRVDPLTSIRGD